MKAQELRTKSREDLQRIEKELSEEIFHLEFRRRSGQGAQVAQIRAARKTLARIKTVQSSQKGSES